MEVLIFLIYILYILYPHSNHDDQKNLFVIANGIAYPLILENTTQEAKNGFIDHDTITNKDILVLASQESSYDYNKDPVLTAKSTGKEKRSFPNSALGLEITIEGTGKTYSVQAQPHTLQLWPSQSKSIKLYSKDGYNEGEYTAKIHGITEEGNSSKIVFAEVSFNLYQGRPPGPL